MPDEEVVIEQVFQDFIEVLENGRLTTAEIDQIVAPKFFFSSEKLKVVKDVVLWLDQAIRQHMAAIGVTLIAHSIVLYQICWALGVRRYAQTRRF